MCQCGSMCVCVLTENKASSKARLYLGSAPDAELPHLINETITTAVGSLIGRVRGKKGNRMLVQLKPHQWKAEDTKLIWC